MNITKKFGFTTFVKSTRVIEICFKLTTVWKNGCSKASFIEILFEGSTTNNLLIKSLGASKIDTSNEKLFSQSIT